MNYQVFARKWRPKKFSEVIGQSHIITAIIQSFNMNRIHHSYILSGTRGSGKTTVARLFAKGLNCKEKKQNKSDTEIICGQCKNCLDIESGCFIDLVEIDAASRSKVEETREILDNVQYAPSQGLFKVYLIDEVHMLSRYSFNALLKTLEEPPCHVKFILITTEHHKIPETILSRCLQFYFKPLNIAQIVTQLTCICNMENIKVHKDALEILASVSKGSMRDALNLLEQVAVLGNEDITVDIVNSVIGILQIERPLSLIENLIDGDIDKIMHEIDNYSILGINWDYLFDAILTIFQKIAIDQFTSSTLQKSIYNDLTEHMDMRIRNLSRCVSPENIQLYYQVFLLGRKELPYAPSYRMGIEMTILRALTLCPVNIKSRDILHNFNIKPNNANYNKSVIKHATIDNIVADRDSMNHNYSDNNIERLESSNLKQNLSISILNKNLNNVINNTSHDDIMSSTMFDQNKIISNKIVSHTTSEILKARSQLINCYKIHHDDQSIAVTSKSNDDIVSKKLLKNILQRFSSINLDNAQHNIINKKKKNNNVKHTEFNKIELFSNKQTQNNLNFILIDMLRQATELDSRISQIYQLNLSNQSKQLLLIAHQETISDNKINLYIGTDFQYLYSQNLYEKLKIELNSNYKILNSLYIIRQNKFTYKTPIEYIYEIYIKKITQLKKEFLADPNIKIIQNLFDATFDDSDIKIC